MLCFAAVAERGSFTAAAAALGYSKAHVSRQVSELERELGAELLLRTTRRFSLTPLGHRCAEQAARLRATFDEAQQLIAAERSGVRGLLRITSATTFGEVFLVDLTSDFQTQYPQVAVEIDMSIQPRDLLDGYDDFAFRITRTIEERLVARAVGLIREIPIAGPALLARHGRPLRPPDLAPMPALRNSHFRDDSEWVFVRGRESETVRLRSPLAINNFSAILHAAELPDPTAVGVPRVRDRVVRSAAAAGAVAVRCDHASTTRSRVGLAIPNAIAASARCS